MGALAVMPMLGEGSVVVLACDEESLAVMAVGIVIFGVVDITDVDIF